MCKLKPVRRQVIILRDEPISKTAGGLVLPESAKNKQKRGTVLDVGEGEYVDGLYVHCCVQEGDIVYFDPFAGTDIELDTGESYYVMPDSGVRCTVRKELINKPKSTA